MTTATATPKTTELATATSSKTNGSSSNGMALALYNRVGDPMTAIAQLGNAFHASGMFGCTNESQGRVLALACFVKARDPFELMQEYHLIDGRLSMRADAMLAKFRERGGKCNWTNIGDDGKEASARFEFEGQKMPLSFTIEEARQAGLIKEDKKGSNWVRWPGPMLRARLISKAIRILAPEIVAGCYTPEEISGEVVDVEFEATPTTTKPAQTNGNLPDPPIGTGEVAVVDVEVEAEAVSSAPFETSTVDTSDADTDQVAKLTDDQLREIAGLKAAGKFENADWQNTLKHHYQVTSAKELTVAQADHLIAKLKEIIQQKGDSEELNNWANNAV